MQFIYIALKRSWYNLAQSREYYIIHFCLIKGKYLIKSLIEQKILCGLIDKIGVILPDNKKRAAFVNNPYNIIEISRNLPR
jgi:hypothetical protein